MKYMGSKRWMLSNGLGTLLVDRSANAERFVDLFSGTAAVSWHVAHRQQAPVLAIDLQSYSSVLARAVLDRTQELRSPRTVSNWIERAEARSQDSALWTAAEGVSSGQLSARKVLAARALCKRAEGVVTSSYGGYYFSPKQAIMIDSLRETLPRREPGRTLSLATLIWAITRCVASPGHTAQPFQPTPTALPFIADAWERDVVQAVSEVFPMIAARKANVRGEAMVDDAKHIAESVIAAGDLVFVDPPYSAAQYSRFYHVLETVAKGDCGDVSGEGRYPPSSERPRSLYSLRSRAPQELADLLDALGHTGCEVVMTFPQQQCSNGLSGEAVIDLAKQWFEVDVSSVVMHHSTLGGNNMRRAARRSSRELIMSMVPK
ncbi:MAG: DNA adenine methylase [Solirubrobacteraceae bacterium]